MPLLDALIAAGAPDSGSDALATSAGVRRKVEIDLCGRPMIWWTLRALRDSGRLGQLVVLGGEPPDISGIEGPIECLPVRGSILDKVLAGLVRVVELSPQAKLVLFVSGDVPLLLPATVNWFIDACRAEEADLYYPVVERSVMEGRFPGAARTYVPLREGRFCGGDIVMARVDVALAQQSLVRRLMEQRKHPWQQAKLIGMRPLLKLLLHRLSLDDAERIAGRSLGLQGKVIISPHADLAMDVDKPHHLAVAREALAGRSWEAQ